MRDIVRRCIFRPYAKGRGPTFCLTMWDTGRLRDGNKCLLGYTLTMLDSINYAKAGTRYVKRDVLFHGEDFGCSPLHAIDGNDAVVGLMTFLTLRPGDTDSDYFANYTPVQLEYCSQHAEALYCEVQARFCDENGRVK